MKELESFHIVFQISKKIVFEVSYYRLGSNKHKHFSTSVSVFNRPKTDYTCCGQCQPDFLTGLALDFYNNWDHLHCEDLSREEYYSIILELESLQNKYNYICTYSDISFGFEKIRELSLLPLKKTKL